LVRASDVGAVEVAVVGRLGERYDNGIAGVLRVS